MFDSVQRKALILLEKYFAETSREKIEADIKAVSDMQFMGPTVEEYFAVLRGGTVNEFSPETLAESSFNNYNDAHAWTLLDNTYAHATNAFTSSSLVANSLNTDKLDLLIIAYGKRGYFGPHKSLSIKKNEGSYRFS